MSVFVRLNIFVACRWLEQTPGRKCSAHLRVFWRWPVNSGWERNARDGARALRLERAWTPRARPDVFRLREGPPVSQVDPAMPSFEKQPSQDWSTTIFASEERQLFPTMTCAVPDFLANRSLRRVDAMGCKTAKVGGNCKCSHHESLLPPRSLGRFCL